MLNKLISRGDHITAIIPKNSKFSNTNVDFHYYEMERGNGADTDPLAIEIETKVLRGRAVSKVASRLKDCDYFPDLIIGHSGWGECLFLNIVWPDAKLLYYIEYAYNIIGSDTDFEDVHKPINTLESLSKVSMKNSSVFMSLDQMTWGITPTIFQYNTLPSWGKAKTSVIHDGINTNWACPGKAKGLKLYDGTIISSSDKVITFINRTYEPYRGIHVFLQSLVDVFKTDKDVKVLLVGNDTPNVSYGAARNDGQGWLSWYKQKLGNSVDWNRVYNLGLLSHDELREIYRISKVHVYLTYPFVLSWSLLEAMSCGCLVIGSDTEPVREVIKHNENGFLVPFDNSKQLANQIVEALNDKAHNMTIRKNARKTIINNYNLDDCLVNQLNLINKITDSYC